MAVNTERVQCGVLVYSIGFRHPPCWRPRSRRSTTLGRTRRHRHRLRVGAQGLRDLRVPFPSVGERTDMLEEAARCISGLLHDETVDFDGKYFQFSGARQEPARCRTDCRCGSASPARSGASASRAVRRWLELGFPSPEVLKHKRGVLDRHMRGHRTATQDAALLVNLQFLLGKDAASLPEAQQASALAGSVDQIVDRIGTYVEAGADQVNFFLPYPWD